MNAQESDISQGLIPTARAFAQGTGVLLQTVGMILFLSTCCVCSLAGLWDPTLSRPAVLQQLDSGEPIGLSFLSLFAQPAKAGVMLMAMFMTVGGLAMAVFGLGLQSEKPRSAWGAMATVILMMIVLCLSGVGLWVDHASWSARSWHGILTVVVLVVFGFTWAALRQMIACPPAPDNDVLRADYKIPYSHYHDDPPDVRLAKELANRRARLEAEQRELEKLERESGINPSDGAPRGSNGS